MDEDPLVAALRRHAPTSAGVSPWDLTAGARRRAGWLRTRRRAGFAVLVVAVVGVPAGVAGSVEDSSRVVESRVSDHAPDRAPDAVAVLPVLTDADVAAVLPGAVRGDDTVVAAGADVRAGLCVDVAFDGPPLDGRTVEWTTPTREGLRQRVHRFAGEGAAGYVQTARDQAASCAVSAPGTGPWTVVGDGGTGVDDLVTAWALVEEGSGTSLYRVRGIAERDGVVVDVTADLWRASADGLSETAADLALGGWETVESS